MAEFNRWEGNTWNAMGDSITEGNEYVSIVESILNIETVNNYGISATCLASGSGSDTDSMAYRVKNMDNNADIVTIFGGTNDWGNNGGLPLGVFGDKEPTTIYGAVDSIINTVMANNPKARLAFITPLQRNYTGTGSTQRGWSESTVNLRGDKLIQVVDAIIMVCSKYSVPVLDLYRNSGITDLNKSQWLEDGLHPNKDGYEWIGKQIASFLNRL